MLRHVVGKVEIQFGGQVVTLPIAELEFDSDSDDYAGGFYSDGDEAGILVAKGIGEDAREKAVQRACEDAVQFLSKRFLN